MFTFVLLLLFLCTPAAGAEEITNHSGIPQVQLLFDGDLKTTQHLETEASVTVYRQEGIGSVYLVFDRDYGVVNLTDEESGEMIPVPTGGMLHFFADLKSCFQEPPRTLTVSFPAGEALVNEVGVFPPGEVPDWVQRWERIPDGRTDLMLLSTHGDDEQLFFAGLLPWYAGECGYRVQVVYFTDHRNLTPHRVHEMLDGLWAVGVRDYPVFGHYEDYYTFDLEDAYRYYAENGHPRQALLGFVTEQLRRCRPLVAVGHDPRGEYGHGMHQLTADLLKEAVGISADPEAFPEQLDRYAPWQVPKTYLHLYPQNPVTMDWDVPMEAFGGMSAYEVTRDKGFPCHASQVSDFAWYFRGADRASEITKYSPCRYGLYQTTVGEDTGKADFFENLEPRPTLMPSTEPPQSTEPTQIMETPAAIAQSEPVKPRVTAQKTWILLPALGALMLTILTAISEKCRHQEKSQDF